MSEESYPRTLYVGNLDPSVSEQLLLTLFGRVGFGSCKGCKIIHEPSTDLYAFVEFADHNDAQMALLTMNKRMVLGRELKVNWATSPGNVSRQDTSKHYHVFVGNLSPDIESHQLREAFTPFGCISDCKVIRDPQTNKSKGFGFVCFIKKEDAEVAIAGMNGQLIGARAIRTNWATGKGSLAATTKSTSTLSSNNSQKSLSYDEVFNQTSATNTTVYCGGIMTGLTDELMMEVFQQFGNVEDCKVFKEKGFAFVKLNSKDAATQAILNVHGSEIGGYSVKCSWGKEFFQSSSGPNNSGPPASAQQNYAQQQQQMGYWGYPQPPYAPAAYVQPYMQPPYNYYNYSGGAPMSWSGTGPVQGQGQFYNGQ